MENIELKAKKFAINAHRGQVRKSDPIKPMIVHPINVGQILKEYGYDSEVVAAGYLHDVVEDTKYTLEDIEKEFGKNIASLVDGASEPDKSLSWEERKQHTIDRTKKLDQRHKAIICADKISNLEDFRFLSEINGKYDFSAFKRGFDSQKWYYTEIYNSLLVNDSIDNPMLVRLKELIDYIYNDQKDDLFIKDTIFKNNNEEYIKLKQFHYRKNEIYKLMNVLNHKKPYIIEITGTPRTGKTTLINNLYDFFHKHGFNVCYIEEFTTSKKYKEEIKPFLKDKMKKIVNLEIPKNILMNIKEAVNQNYDIIIVDRGLLDRLIWVDRLYLKDGMTKKEYEDYKKKYLPIIKKDIDLIIATVTDSNTSLKRDYLGNLSLEKRSFLNQQNIDEYNTSLYNISNLTKEENINFNIVDTTNKNQRVVSFEVVDIILSSMKDEILKRVKEEFE